MRSKIVKEVSEMRKVLAVAFVGASLAFASTAAFAEGNGGHDPVQSQQDQIVMTHNDSASFVVAGPSAPVSVWTEMREQNRDR
jgi:hypothetical protein